MSEDTRIMDLTYYVLNHNMVSAASAPHDERFRASKARAQELVTGADWYPVLIKEAKEAGFTDEEREGEAAIAHYVVPSINSADANKAFEEMVNIAATGERDGNIKRNIEAQDTHAVYSFDVTYRLLGNSPDAITPSSLLALLGNPSWEKRIKELEAENAVRLKELQAKMDADLGPIIPGLVEANNQALRDNALAASKYSPPLISWQPVKTSRGQCDVAVNKMMVSSGKTVGDYVLSDDTWRKRLDVSTLTQAYARIREMKKSAAEIPGLLAKAKIYVDEDRKFAGDKAPFGTKPTGVTREWGIDTASLATADRPLEVAMESAIRQTCFLSAETSSAPAVPSAAHRTN